MPEEKIEYQWGRLYAEWAEDIKVQSMSEVDQRRHAMLLCMHIRGFLNPSDHEIAVYCRISEKKWKKTKEIFIEKGFIATSGNHLINWERRQFKSDKSNERVRNFRERNSYINGDVTLQKRYRNGDCNVTVTPPDTDTDTDTEEKKEEEDIYIPNSRALEANGSEEPKKNASRPNPLFGDISGEYHRLLPELPRYGIWSSKDHLNVKLGVDAFPERADVSFWTNLFSVTSQCPYLLGKNGRSRGQPWKASLTWLLELDNIANILNGKYLPGENKSAGQKTYEALKDEVWE